MSSQQPHNVLVVGVGSIGERHVRCFQATGRASVSICDVDNTLLSIVQRRYGIQHAYANFDDALQGNHDVVVIATPAHLHIDMARAAATAGRHLLIEKPLSTTMAGVESLSDCVKANGLTAMVAYVMRSHPSLSAMKRAIDDGRFGAPVHLYATCGQHFPTYRPAYRDIYYNDRRTGGGAVQDALTHFLNAGQWLLGPINRLVADAAHQVLEGVQVEDTVNVLARHGDVPASYAYNQYQSPNESTLTVVCKRGTARFEYHNARWRCMTQPDTPWEEETVDGFERDSIFIRQANAFLDAVDGLANPLCTIDEGLWTLRANLAVLESLDNEQRWIIAET